MFVWCVCDSFKHRKVKRTFIYLFFIRFLCGSLLNAEIRCGIFQMQLPVNIFLTGELEVGGIQWN